MHSVKYKSTVHINTDILLTCFSSVFTEVQKTLLNSNIPR